MKEKPGHIYVKSQEQFENPQDFEAIKIDEFPHRKSMLDVNRRELLKFMGGSLAMAGLASGCRYLPQQKIVPFVQAPENRLPGQEAHFASVSDCGGYGIGVLVRSYEGRPVKIEGHPLHPSSRGAVDSRTQAELAVMYDPERLRNPEVADELGGWDEFYKRIRSAMSQAHDGAGVAILTQNIGSPTLAAQINGLLKAMPGAKWYQYEPVNRDNIIEGSTLAFGRIVETVYDFSHADVVLSIEADVFQEGPGRLAYQRDIMARRNVAEDNANMNRLYAVEGFPTLFGVTADHRWRLKSTKMLEFVQALAFKLGIGTQGSASGINEKNLDKLAKDLQANHGKSVVVAGSHLPAGVHAVVHAINEALGNMGTTITTLEPVLAKPTSNGSDIQNLTDAMKGRQVSCLLIIGGNPVYDAPSDLKFDVALAQVPFSAHLSLTKNETAQRCTWQLPMSHWLEAWGDQRGHDGLVSIVQPLINPIFDSKSPIEVLEALNKGGRSGEEVVQDYWKAKLPAGAGNWQNEWDSILATGFIQGTASVSASVTVVPQLTSAIRSVKSSELDLVILPDPTIFDGRFAGIGWLQELPKPLTNITWDNSVQMSPATAKKLGVGQATKVAGVIPFYGNWSVVKVTANGQTVEGPVYVHHGMADDMIVLHMGYGRTELGATANVGDPVRHGGGFNAMPLRTSSNPIFVHGATIEKTGRDYKLANTQFHNLLDVTEVDSLRDVIRETTLADYLKNKEVLQHPTTKTAEIKGEERERTSISKGPEGFNTEDQYQWAMTIDLNLCTGCNACVTACQAENNIPTVGKEQVLRHRMMHWIRIDRYYRAQPGQAFDENDPVTTFQPVTCVQCEKAPCEPVCPVAATTHSHEGINQMVYNRCVGTRYCSNNCPYKVRRFNYLHYTKAVEDTPVLKLLQNPDVTVRYRGIMEKCTYCVQRINHARIEAKKAGVEIKDGDVVTACQQACPSRAIIFGDMRRAQNAVSKSRASNRNYVLLENLNTRPRTTYLGKVRNPNPEIEA